MRDPALAVLPPSVRAPVDRANRVLLTALGLLSLAGGIIVLLLSYDVFGDLQGRQPLLRRATREFADRNAGWFWLAAGVGGGLVALLALRWLVAQVSTVRVIALELEPDRRRGHTRLAAGALSEAVADEVSSVPGVARASARLLGSAAEPALRILVELADDADVGAVRRAVETEAVPHARQAAGLPALPVEVRLSLVPVRRRPVR